jgi:cytochrome c oxidase subunit 2
MEKLIVLHDFIMAFLVAIVFFVLSLLFFLITRFVDKHDGPVLRITQIQHNSLLEFVWTVVPFVILLIIFSSSAALIYDGANKTNISTNYRVIGNQ